MDMNFIFSWSTRYLTRSLRSLVRYRLDHSKIKFISTRGHVISSISTFVGYTSNLSISYFKSTLQKHELLLVAKIAVTYIACIKTFTVSFHVKPREIIEFCT